LGFTQGFYLALLANILWGTSFLVSKETLQYSSPIGASFIRFLLAVVLLFFVSPMFGNKIRLPKKSAIPLISLVGLTGFGLLYPLQLFGLQQISTGLSAAIMLSSPLFVLLLGALFLNETLSRNKLNAVFLGIIGGCLLLYTRDPSMVNGSGLWGIISTFSASICLALSVVATRKLFSSKNQLDSANLTFWSMTVGLICWLPFIDHSHLSQTQIWKSWFAFSYLALICSVLCFFAWNKALTMADAKDIASTMHIKTPVAIVLGILLSGESFSFFMVVGTALISIGIWKSQHPNRVKGSAVAAKV
jgi:probable blue pigment (indigoidine) exporter